MLSYTAYSITALSEARKVHVLQLPRAADKVKLPEEAQ